LTPSTGGFDSFCSASVQFGVEADELANKPHNLNHRLKQGEGDTRVSVNRPAMPKADWFWLESRNKATCSQIGMRG
jgi:hypothetical protein